MYRLYVYNGVDIEDKGKYEKVKEAFEELKRAEKEYMSRFNYEKGSTEYNQELDNFIANSRIIRG